MMFSIIIPAYNAQDRIYRLLRSIRDQTCTDYEVIVVCDSCTDSTETVAKAYGAITDRVSFGSDGLTRDRALELASGDWILFADDDDWFYNNNVFNMLHNYIELMPDNIDLIAFGYIKGKEGYVQPSRQNVFTPRIDHVWSSCWRRSRIGNARFGDAVFCSDTYFLKAMRDHVRGIAILDAPLYYYNFLRPGSQTDLFRRGILKQSPVAE